MKNFTTQGYVILVLGLSFSACSGMKVVNPERQKDSGAVLLDWSGKTPKVVSTYSCSVVAGNGKRVSAIGKSEEEARNEALATCRDQTIVSVCLEKNVRCDKN
jgi:hypothetical protein